MRLLLTKAYNTVLIIIILPLTLFPLCLLLPVCHGLGCLHSEFVRLLFLQDHRETSCRFRSLASAIHLPLPSLGVVLTA
jgi:hypothetical protein